MQDNPIQKSWLNAFVSLFTMCKASIDEQIIILIESHSRQVNIMLTELALQELKLPFEIVRTETKPAKCAPIVRSTGASNALDGEQHIVEALCKADFIIDLTVEGLMHARSTSEILKSGARIMTISNEHPEILARLPLDPALKDAVKNAVSACRNASAMHVTSTSGTDLHVTMANTVTVGVWGWTDRPGTLAHWPGGLVVSFPHSSSTNGILAFKPGDINLTFKRYFDSDVRFHINDDFVTKIEGTGTDARLMRHYLAGFDDPLAYATSHVGWGLNPHARYEALTMYDKDDLNGTELRALAGNFLFSTGANEFAGRYTEGHFDLPMMDCTITLDGHKVVDEGVIC
ncbi:peptidase M29 [Alphaproteobacteria bacterium]|nr:peptidase M29 [Alphaproteobacteria bacterium]